MVCSEWTSGATTWSVGSRRSRSCTCDDDFDTGSLSGRNSPSVQCRRQVLRSRPYGAGGHAVTGWDPGSRDGLHHGPGLPGLRRHHRASRAHHAGARPERFRGHALGGALGRLAAHSQPVPQDPLPDDLAEVLADALEARLRGEAVAVRSSAPGEDSDTVSFAGLHESFINVSGVDRILKHVRLVWASLWSDAALLYRRDLGLDVSSSTMAVVVQELVTGDRSGVAFSQNPNDASQAVIESVYGLNQGLVDGTVEPDQWIVDRATGDVVFHQSPPREQRLVTGPEGVQLETLPEDLSLQPPLTPEDVMEVFECAQQLEAIFGRP
ncbi:MAG: PEP/pyruvate-binding domain-containing protein [Chloroflexota bacterium]|nr:PEP/pyruvate-binding domain-containing protein [Chloroflexota bacterium]